MLPIRLNAHRDEAEGMQDSKTSSCQTPPAIFAILVVVVQAFMAFNGGATSATIDSIEQEDPTWDPAGIGVLGAMDKLGMTLASPVCGFLFQAFPANILLGVGLFINASACLLFGSLRLHYSMFAAKLLIGVTEGLQWVWSPQWISLWGSVGQKDETRKQTWMNVSSSIVAGVGAGIGILVAGFGTANGLSYAFAFKIEAGALFCVWVYYLFLDGKLVAVDDIAGENGDCDAEQAEQRQRNSSGRAFSGSSTKSVERSEELLIPAMDRSPSKPRSPKSISQQIGELWNNPLFCRCAVAFATVNFVTSGIQFLWVRLFTGLWPLVTKSHAVLSQLIVVAAGGGTGVALASNVHFTDSPNGPQRPRFTTKAFGLAAVGASVAASGAFLQMTIPGLNQILTLGTVYIGVFVTCLGLNMTPGILQIICLDTVDADQTRAFGTGVYQGLNNFLGLAMGPFIPQMVMSIIVHSQDIKMKDGEEPPMVLCCGFICALSGVLISLSLSAMALSAATETPAE